MSNWKPSGNAVVTPSADLGPRPKFAWLPIDVLVVDDRYQRKITADGIAHINKIVRNFSWSKYQPLTVTGPDASGDYPVIDGQHRLDAARRHPLVTEVPCWIVEAPKISDQATSFVAVNQDRIRVTKVNVFWAQLTAGEPAAVRIRAIADQAGVKIGRIGTGIQPPLTTVALETMGRLADRIGDDFVIDGLRLIAEAQPDVENAFRAPVVLAVTRIAAMYGSYDRPRLVSVLSELDFDEVIEKARTFRKTMGGNVDAAVQALIGRAYNKGLRGGAPRLPES